jgi:hypothetical protein
MLHVGSDLDRKRVDVCLISNQGYASERPDCWFRGRAGVLAKTALMPASDDPRQRRLGSAADRLRQAMRKCPSGVSPVLCRETQSPFLEHVSEVRSVQGSEAPDVVIDVVNVKRLHVAPHQRGGRRRVDRDAATPIQSIRGERPSGRGALLEVPGDRELIGPDPSGRRRVQEANREEHELGQSAYPARHEQVGVTDLLDGTRARRSHGTQSPIRPCLGRLHTCEELKRKLGTGNDELAHARPREPSPGIGAE